MLIHSKQTLTLNFMRFHLLLAFGVHLVFLRNRFACLTFITMCYKSLDTKMSEVKKKANGGRGSFLRVTVVHLTWAFTGSESEN